MTTRTLSSTGFLVAVRVTGVSDKLDMVNSAGLSSTCFLAADRVTGLDGGPEIDDSPDRGVRSGVGNAALASYVKC